MAATDAVRREAGVGNNDEEADSQAAMMHDTNVPRRINADDTRHQVQHSYALCPRKCVTYTQKGTKLLITPRQFLNIISYTSERFLIVCCRRWIALWRVDKYCVTVRRFFFATASGAQVDGLIAQYLSTNHNNHAVRSGVENCCAYDRKEQRRGAQIVPANVWRRLSLVRSLPHVTYRAVGFPRNDYC